MNIPDMALKLRQKLESADGSSFFYVYMDEVDTTCHRYGPFSPQQDAQLENISDCLSRELGELSEDVAENTTVVFTADHGQVEVSDYIDLYDHGIEEDLEVRNGDTISPCGTKRAVFLHLKDEREGAVRRKLSDLNLRIYTPDEAIDAGLFGDGEVSDRLRERVGDLLLVPEGREAVWYGDMDKTGVHGGMHENEMYVPFCAAKVSDIVD
jgi:predicted AlkP superfamily pyrophosphatase or phosphodiesterase